MYLSADKKDCGGAKRAVTPEIYFPKEADQEHYLNVASTYKRWRSASPSPSPASTSVSSESSLILGSPLFMDNSTDSTKNDSSLSTTTDDGCEDDPLAAKAKSSIENIDKICNVGVGRHKRHRRTSSQTRNSLSEDVQDCSQFPFLTGRKRTSEGDQVVEYKDEEKPLTMPNAEAAKIPEDTFGKDGVTSVKEQPTSGLIVMKLLDNSKAATLSRSCKWGGHFRKIPDGGEVTLSELREMATRQQHQIESQQQLLVAREQRLKYLKQQEGRSAQISLEAERLRRLRERVEAQEAKLRRLRALRGQVDSSLMNAASLSSDLEAMRLLFSEKEKELVDAASKVEELTKQLEEVRAGRAGAGIHQNGTACTTLNNSQNHHLQIHHQELDKLRRELLYRNSVNREASSRVASQKEALSTRKDEIVRIDKRIAELQQRLYRKRFLNQQLASQISAATQAKQAQLKAVQQKAKREGNKDNSLDDITAEERRTMEDIAHFERGAQDPKYQTLPYNTKFSSGNKEGSPPFNSGPPPPHSPQTTTVPNCGSNVVTRTVHSIPTHLPSKGHASAPLTTSGSSVVVGSTASHTVPTPSPQISHPATASLNRGHQNGSLRPNYLHPQQHQPSHLPIYNSKISPQSDESSSNKQPQTIHNGSALQDQRANLPPTSLSVSFSQKHINQTIAANGQQRTGPLSNNHQPSIQPVNKDVENVRALGFPPGGSSSSVSVVKSLPTNGAPISVEESRESSTGGVKIKPSLPPKPSPHSKPTPPPRQKGDPLAGSTESLNLTGITRNNSQNRPQVFRYASQNVILSTYTQQQQQQQSSQEQKPQSLQSEPKQIDLKQQSHSQQQDSQLTNQFQQSFNSGSSTLSQQYKESKQSLSNETSVDPKDTVKDCNESAGEKVHISISRRIEMPPDFLFPEDAAPPSDLIGRPLDDLSKTGGSSSSDSGYDAPDKTHTINNNDIINKNNTNNINRNNSSNSVNSINNNNNIKDVNNFNTNNNNVTSTLNDIERLKITTSNADTQTQETRKKHQKLNVNVEDFSEKEMGEESHEKGEEALEDSTSLPTSSSNSLVVRRLKKGNLKKANSSRSPRRVSFDPLALLLDASLEGELELVKRTATEVTNPSAANDEGITALHNAICAGHLDIVTFLVTFGCDVNAQDSDGWTPLHCAASCNNVSMVRFLVEHGACVLATTLSDHETAAEKCEQDEEGYDGCSQYLYSVQEKLGIMNGGVVYAVYDYDAQNDDELTLKCNDRLNILRRGDEYEPEWWWAKNDEKKTGYVPRNLLGLYPRVKNIFKDS